MPRVSTARFRSPPYPIHDLNPNPVHAIPVFAVKERDYEIFLVFAFWDWLRLLLTFYEFVQTRHTSSHT